MWFQFGDMVGARGGILGVLEILWTDKITD